MVVSFMHTYDNKWPALVSTVHGEGCMATSIDSVF
jgi:hypothetical protein